MKQTAGAHIILSLSGGLDSTVLLAMLKERWPTIEAVSFNYGSKHNDWEIEAARRIAGHYSVCHSIINLNDAFTFIDSNLLKTGDAIPEGDYNDESMSQTVVSCRNMIFVSFLAAIAESRGASHVGLGVHQGDHFIYPDCRPQFIDQITQSILSATEERIHLIAPFLCMTKGYIVEKGLTLKAPFHLTRTCYKDQGVACGQCGACRERLEAFEQNAILDPIEYVNSERR